MKKLLLSFLLINTFAYGQKKPIIQAPMKLWYDKPATYFEEALVLGNGRVGATVFGGTSTDKIFLNDITLWSGEPVDPYMNKEAYKHLPGVREALKQENYRLADSLVKKLQGKFSESYAPLGTLYLDFDAKNPKNYYRELDLDKAIASVKYQEADNLIQKEYFVSYPDKVIVIHLKSSQKGGLSFKVRFDSQLKYKNKATINHLHFQGNAPVRAEPNYVRKKGNPIIYMENRGTRFSTDVLIQQTDGRVVQTDSTLSLEKGTEATVLVSLATSFNGFDKNPNTQGLDDDAIAEKQLQEASKIKVEDLRKKHIQDYQTYYQRVQLALGGNKAPELPTDERLRRYAKGESDPYLETLYFQFGRYLLISSSRTPGVPANLQGLWNPHIQPPWSSNYTMNINAEENYWLAENTNLSEMHTPFLTFLENLEKTGKITAKTFYDAPGWTVHHNSDIWAMSNPVGDFGNGSPSWANWYMGGAWASTHLWEHYLFTKDEIFLKQKAYPLMKGAAEFCLAMLIPDKNGNLMTSPSTSPENRYITPSGYQGETIYGGSADLAMIRELFADVIAAQERLNVDKEMKAKLQSALGNLYPYKVGKKGNLQEWYYDWEDTDSKHRHQSHLFGLYPGSHLTVEKTPELTNAAKRTLEIKGDETTGWSKGWRINLWARLKDGDHAYKMYRELLKYVEPDGVKVNYQRGGGTYPNLFDAHPPFQIDGNFGGAAAVAEMLLQSGPNEIQILPALPSNWKDGQVKGLKARGGFEIDMTWKNGQLTDLHVLSSAGTKSKIVYQGKSFDLNLKKGESKNMIF
ncbi:glycoside hydrolase family 95 protein [Aquirufa sp. ROCK2-A2]